jgi:hypothetical protein
MVRTNTSLTKGNREKLLGLLATLGPEMEKLSKVQAEQAKSIAEYINRSTREAMRLEKDPVLLKESSEGLSDSIRRFEASHPELVSQVNSIATFLANIGI